MHSERFVAFFLCVLLAACGDTAEEPLAGLTVADGFTIEVAAAAPLVERPMILSSDHEGRLYVAESSGSNDPVEKQLSERPHSILRLTDEDGDGVYDERTVFADGMMLPEGVLWHDGSVYVAAPPTIWKLTDTDDDGVADEREEWFDGGTLTGCANDLHGPYLGLDGWIYWAKGAFAEQTHELTNGETLNTHAAHIFRRRPQGGPIEVVLTGGMDNPVEVAFLPTGERFITSTFLHQPALGLRDGLIHALYGGVYGKVHQVVDDHPQTGGLLDAMTHLGPAAPVGLLAYRSEAFGEDYQHNLFATMFNTHKVTRHVLNEKGATFETFDSDFLVSESPDFHPTDVLEDADGSLLVVDTGAWYKLCCPTSQLAKPDMKGAIYRIRRVDAQVPRDPRGSEIDWKAADAGELARLLSDTRPAVRDRATAAIVSMGSAATDALRDGLGRARTHGRLAMIWALTRIDAPEARSLVRLALRDENPDVRHAAAHSVGLWRDAEAVERLSSMIRSDSPAIARAAAEAAGRIGDRAAVPAILEAARVGGEIPSLAHSLTYALIEIGDADATRSGLLSDSEQTRRTALIALSEMKGTPLSPKLALRIMTTGGAVERETAVWIAGRHPEWGAELAGYFEQNLSAEGADALMARFIAAPEVQAFAASAALNPRDRDARLAALRAMAAYSGSDVPEGWTEALGDALTSPQADISHQAVKTVRVLPEPLRDQMRGDLLAFAANGDAAHAARTEALAAAAADGEELPEGLFDFLLERLNGEERAAVRSSAATALTGFALNEPQKMTLAAALEDAGALELPRLLDAFAGGGDEALGRRLVASLEAARAPGGLRPAQVEALMSEFPSPVQEAAGALIKSLDEDREAQRERLETIATNLGEGDVRRGQAVFNGEKAACKSCHAIGYEGGRVGPDLTKIGKIRERKDLLEAILYPSAAFVRSYEPVIVETTTDIHNGIPTEDTPEQLTLAVGADEEVRIPRAEVQEIRPGKVSVMPAGLEDELTDQELADLIAFLEATRWGS